MLVAFKTTILVFSVTLFFIIVYIYIYRTLLSVKLPIVNIQYCLLAITLNNISFGIFGNQISNELPL